MNITFERIAPPAPPSPTNPTLSASQRRFLALHANHLVTEWRWHFLGTQLRASADGQCCTLGRSELDDLVALGLMRRGVGNAVEATAAGRELAGLECVA